jgi:TolB-like protein
VVQAWRGRAVLLFRFEDFSLDSDRRELRRGADLVPIEPQVFDLLVHLVRNRDRVVSKDDMIAAVWGGRIVSESALTNRINAARAALGDSGEAQRLIKTLQRKGIRFVGEVHEEPPTVAATAAPVAPEQPAPALALPDRPSIAVLPFENVSDDAEQEYFAIGMADEIITALSRCGWLFVIARNSSFTYRGKAVDVRRVGRELGVRYVLEGSVRRAGSRVRLGTQLVEAENGVHIWADRFEGDMSDVFELQDRITESVVAAVEPKLQFAEFARLKQKPVSSLDAYDLYLRALHLEYRCTEESLEDAIRCLERAALLDPTFAPAMALASFCYAERAFQAWARDYAAENAEALRLANRAVELDPQNAEVLWMSAYAIAFLGGDAPRGKELFERSLAINPNSPMALTMSCWPELNTGNIGLAAERIARARRLSPRDPHEWMMSMTTGMMHMWAHEFPDCVAWSERAIRQNPRALPALRTMVVGLVHSNQKERAARTVTQILEIDPSFTVSSWRRQRAPHFRQENPRFDFILDAYRAAGVPE